MDDFYTRDVVDDTQGARSPRPHLGPPTQYKVSESASGRSRATPATTRSRTGAPGADYGSQRLVIGIDVGTTYTGIAYATPRSNIATLEGDHGVRVVNTWNTRMSNLDKVPTVISFTPATEEHEQWGTDLSDDAVAIVNIKLELAVQPTLLDELELTLDAIESTGFLSFDRVRQPRSTSVYTWKTPEQIISDFLGKILKNLLRETREFNQVNRELLSTDIVITVPADWPYEAENSIFRAIRKAGFDRTSFPRLNKVLMTTEPEAASLYTAHYLKEDRRTQLLKLNECFVLCDAGGGTVDLVAFQVKQLEPHLVLHQITKPTSGRCGATYINKDFKKWFRRIIGRDNYRMMDPEGVTQRISSRTVEGGDLRRLMREFEVRKNLFNHGSDPMYIDLRGPLEGLDKPPILRHGQLTINPDDMRRFFEPYVNQVVELIDKQCTQVETDARHQVKNVFLVGGFGESPYLQEELRESLKDRGIALQRPDQRRSWTAVVQGAVIHGIEKAQHQNLRSGVPSPRSYGIVIDEAFVPHRYNSRDLRRDHLSNEEIAHEQFAWLVRKGDLLFLKEKVSAEKAFTYKFLPDNHNLKHILRIYEHLDQDDTVPERWATGQGDVTERGQVMSDLSAIPINTFERRRNEMTSQIYYTAYLVCKMQLTTEVLEVQVFAGEQCVGRTEILVLDANPGSDSDSD